MIVIDELFDADNQKYRHPNEDDLNQSIAIEAIVDSNY